MVEILGRRAQKYNVAFGGRNTGSVSPIWRAPPNASLMRTACSSTQQHSCKGPLEYIYVSSNFALQKLSYSITPASLTPCTAFIILIRLQLKLINITLNYFAPSTSKHILMHHARWYLEYYIIKARFCIYLDNSCKKHTKDWMLFGR